jgi:hypothetical protein
MRHLGDQAKRLAGIPQIAWIGPVNTCAGWLIHV